MLRPLDRLHAFCLALRAFKLQHNFFRCLSLLVEDGLRLAAETRLLLVVSPFPLCTQRGLASLVLRYLMRRVFLAFAAVRVAGFRNVDHGSRTKVPG